MFDVALIVESIPFLLRGAVYTVQVSVLAIVFGLVLGWLLGLAAVSGVAALRAVAWAYVQFIRGTPLLVQIFLIYFGLPVLRIDIPAFWSGVQTIRRVIPPLTNELITLTKSSSLLSAIAALELTHAGQLIIARTFAPFEIYAAVAVIYLIMVGVLSRGSALLEKRVFVNY